MQALYRQTLLNQDVVEWLNHPRELFAEMYRLSQIQASFIEFINSRSGVVSVYLHNKRNNMVLSTPFMLSELPQFPNHQVFEQYDYANNSVQWQYRQIGNEVQSNPSSARVISMVAGIPATNKQGAIAINMNEKYVAESIMAGDDYLLWLDADNHVLLAKNEASRQFYAEHAEQILSTKQSSFFLKDHFVISSVSEAGKWKLLTILPTSVLENGLSDKSAYKTLILVLCLALTVLLSLYFRYIRREQDKLKDLKIRQNLGDFRIGLITDLLNGKPVLADLEERSRQYEINLTGGGYQVIVFQIDDYYQYLLTKTNNERFFMNKIIFNAIKWTFALKFNAHIISTQLERVTVLICHDVPDEAGQGKLEETIHYIQNDIRDNCGLTVCVGVSDIATDIAHVHACHAHAMMAIDYKSIYGKHAVIYYERMSFSKSPSLQQLSQKIHQISDYLQEGRLDRIEICLEDILGELIANQQFTLDWVHAIFANMMSTIMKFTIEHRIDINHHCKEDVFITLYSYEFLEDKKTYILKICSVIIDLMQTKPVETSSTTKVIIEYIDKHFDQPISLNILADRLSMSSSYLSVVIKNHLGIGFVEYISKLRIQKAIKLLDNNQLTIQHIAEQCGYDTVHTFIRQFKKVYQIPPNEYRLRKRNEEM
ncbi:helix-turn-helix transcriptional regulator [Paenibacillus konkukensis]|nr:AraC family transcriptional regulator [Paenibacillus konkukensis]